jgi:hypothetical protein
MCAAKLAGCVTQTRLDQGIEASGEGMVEVAGPLQRGRCGNRSEYVEVGYPR